MARSSRSTSIRSIAQSAMQFSLEFFKKSSTQVARGIIKDKEKLARIEEGKWIQEAKEDIALVKELLELLGGSISSTVRLGITKESGQEKEFNIDELNALERKLAEIPIERKTLALEECKNYEMLCAAIRDDVRPLEHQASPEEVDHWMDEHFFYLNACIERSKKYSIGNCHEQAILALLYVLINEPSLSAEVLYIKDPFDHVFLVIERDKKAGLKEMAKWGKAFVCDPWLQIVTDPVNYLRIIRGLNYAEKDQETVIAFSTEEFTKRNTVEALEPICLQYQKKLTIIMDALAGLKKDYSFLVNLLNDSPSKEMLKHRIVSINRLISEAEKLIAESTEEMVKNDFNYWKIRPLFMENLHNITRKANKLATSFPASLKSYSALITDLYHRFQSKLNLLKKQNLDVKEQKAEGKPEEKAEGKPEEKAEGKPEEKAEGKREEKAEGKREERAEGKQEEKTEVKKEAETEGEEAEKDSSKKSTNLPRRIP